VRSVGAAALTAGLLFVPLASAAVFGRPAEIPLAKAPVSAAVSDATQDGNADVVLANASAPILTVLPGRRDGSFERPLVIGEAPVPRSIAVGDFDNDGSDDLAVAGGNELAIFTGREATLVRQGSMSTRAATALATGDLDSDGLLDLLAGRVDESVVSIFLGLGDGTFLAPREHAIGSPATSLFVSDLNGDEVSDVATSGNGVSVLFGNGDGSLGGYHSVGGPSGARALAGDDFDADGFVDLATAHGSNLVTVLRNTGDEQFAQAGSHRVGGTPVALAAVDVDGDGSTDLASANRGTNDVSILLGNGEGQFQEQTRVRVGRTPTGLAIDDLDADGSLDLVTANRGSKTVTVMLNGADAPPPVVCRVPGVARRTLAVARRLVGAANCIVGPVRRKYSKRVRRGRVISVSPLPGTRAPVDTRVTLLVSRGRKR
jgi:FG-GAP-like repeat/PASTA domain